MGLGIKEEKQKEQQPTHTINMGEQFMEPKSLGGTPMEDPREWLEKVEYCLSYKNYADLIRICDITDEDEMKVIQRAMEIVKRRISHVMSLMELKDLFDEERLAETELGEERGGTASQNERTTNSEETS